MERHVFFDFDGTLTTRDSFFSFIRFVRGRWGKLRILLQEIPVLAAYFIGCVSVEKAKERLLKRTLKGFNRERYIRICEAFANKISEEYERKELTKCLMESAERGEHVVIVSGSPGDWIRSWARKYGVTDVVATELDFSNMSELGKLATHDCIGIEKTRRLIARWPDLVTHRSAHHITAYGNSSGDREMLAFADSSYLHKNHKLIKIK